MGTKTFFNYSRLIAVTSKFAMILLFTLSSKAFAFRAVPSHFSISEFDFKKTNYFHDQSDANLYSFSQKKSDFLVALNDKKNLIDDHFHVSAALKPFVGFWLKVYTFWSSDHVIIFDKDNPDVVYEVLDFSDLKKNAKNDIVYEILRNKKINKKLSQYKIALNLFKKNQTSKSEEFVNLRKVLKPFSKKILNQLSSSRVRSQTGQRNFFISGLARATPYIQIMQEVFQNSGIPKDLLFLSLVESSFNINAYSRTGAAGVWQFMRKSALEYIIINDEMGIDERLSPVKSTIAASRLLKRNFKILKNWTLAIAAYHSGPRNLLSISRKNLSKFELEKKLSNPKTSPLGYAGTSYYVSFLALLHAYHYRDFLLGETLDHGELVKKITYYQLKNSESLSNIALKQGFSLSKIHELNPDIFSPHTLLPKGFWIVLPKSESDVSQLNDFIKSRWSHLKNKFKNSRLISSK